MSLFLGQSYRQICINMHTWRGIGILVIFATIEKKENFLPLPRSPLRSAETHIRRTRAAADRQTRDAAKKFQ